MHNFCFWCFCERTHPHEESCYFLRGPVITLNRRAPKARVVPVGGGWVDGDQKGSIFLNFKYVDQYVLRLLNIGRVFVSNTLVGLKIWYQVGELLSLISKIPSKNDPYDFLTQNSRFSIVILRSNFRSDFFFLKDFI